MRPGPPGHVEDMHPKNIGHAGLQGWRAKLADRAAPPLAKRTPLDEDTIRAAVGGVFPALSVMYVVTAIRRIVSDA